MQLSNQQVWYARGPAPRTIFQEVRQPYITSETFFDGGDGVPTEPMQIPKVFRISVCRYFARGMIGTDKTVMIGTRYPKVA